MADTPRVPSTLEARSITLGYDERKVVDGLTVALPPGRVSAIVGANGSGKSTLLRGLARLLRPSGGSVLLDGQDIRSLPSRAVARTIGLLPQAPVPPGGITVAELVGRGRYPHQGWFRRWTPGDDAAVAEALRVTDTLSFADRPVDELSGGQRQRVWIALALAQQTDILLLDEPTTFLDVAHQIEVLDLVTDLNRGAGTTVAMVLHDLNLAARYADHLIVLKDGRLAVQGPPDAVVTPGLVREVFGLQCTVIADPVAGTPLVVPVGRHHAAPVPAGARAGAAS
ncbi:ABC transporter ATP-binding protein [Arthrobacter zhaoguopingii]|uniref:ABC transporter ATP-binding protein n=1 Tax=Arthrobacter zhaoguopingii TaxID=2681491 RepID=UPI00135A4A92|nr:ABC transporter ATP-binding protein [Arthrobacter zhaoguopingii]